MPAERVAMRRAREIIRAEGRVGFSARDFRRSGMWRLTASGKRSNARRVRGALSRPLPEGMNDGAGGWCFTRTGAATWPLTH